jgi:ATP-dependent Clp protease ATP-binding subunit ClpX
MHNPDDLRCSFCHKSQSEVRKLIGGQNALICNECVEMCRNVITRDEQEQRPDGVDPSAPSPKIIKRRES